MTTDRNFNPRLRDAEDRPITARIRGSVERPDFRDKAEPEDPGAVSREGYARAEEAAARRSAAIERDRSGASEVPLSVAARLETFERRVQSLEADAIVMRARLTELEAQRPAKASVSSARGGSPGLPGAA